MTNGSHSSNPTNSGDSIQTKTTQVPHKETEGKPKSLEQDGMNPNMKELTSMEYQVDLEEYKENDDEDRNLKSDNNDSNNNGMKGDTTEVERNLNNDIRVNAMLC